MDLSRIKFNKATLSIILWNLTPYWGVYFLHWEPITVLICYAMETIVIGGFNVFKMVAVYWYGMPEEDNRYVAPGFSSIPFFIIAYTFLVFFQLTSFFAVIDVINQEHQITVFGAIRQFMDDETTYLACTAFVVFNAYSFVTEFILTEEYRKKMLRDQMTEPLPRVIFLQIVVTAAGFIYLKTGSNLAVLAGFSGVKIIAEIALKNYTVSELLSSE